MEYPYPPPPMVAIANSIYAALIAVTLVCLYLFVRSRTVKWPVIVFVVSLIAGWLVAGSLPVPPPETVDRIGVGVIINTLLCVVGLCIAYFRGFGITVGAVTFLMVAGLVFVLLLPAIDQPKKAARRMQCLNNLHNIIIAMQNHASVNNGHLPSAGFTPEDLSWRVELLPLLDSAALYRAYQRDKPWNDPANDEFVKMWLPVYACPSNPVRTNDQRQGLTSYAVLTGPGTAFDGPDSMSLDEIGMAGGISHTVLIVEACGANIVWNEPRDIDVTLDPVGINLPGKTPGSSAGWLSGYHRDTVNVAFADGSVKALSIYTDPKVLKSLATVDAGDNAQEIPRP